MIGLFILAILPLAALSQQCQNSIQCAASTDKCCRHSDGRILNYPLSTDFWTLYAKGNIGKCVGGNVASEGDGCDSACQCGTGLLCAPNLLCRSCGNICMAEDVVNRLVQYYNIGCTCPQPTGSKAPKPSCRPFSSSYKPPLEIVNGVVNLPYF